MLNQLVIDELREGVLVVDRSGQVRAANPAARTRLGEAGGYGVVDERAAGHEYS